MASTLSIDILSPEKFESGWKFTCPTNLLTLVRTNQAANYFRMLLHFIEDELNLVNFQLKIHSTCQPLEQLKIMMIYSENQERKEFDCASTCISCDSMHPLSQATLLSENIFTYGWLDFRLRQKLILTPKRHVQRLSELRDENGEMSAFWFDAIQLITAESQLKLDGHFPVLSINQGTFRKHEHLHLKMDLDQEFWDRVIVDKYQKQLESVGTFLRQIELIENCFSPGELQHVIDRGLVNVDNHQNETAGN